MPGDIFVLRNAGNTCTHAEGSMVGSLEFATGALKSRLILVLGHTQCGAIKGATATHFAAQAAEPGLFMACFAVSRAFCRSSVVWS